MDVISDIIDIEDIRDITDIMDYPHPRADVKKCLHESFNFSNIS